MTTSIRFRFFARCVGLALIGGAVLSPQVFADEFRDQPAVTVKFSDLNLEAASGVKTLYNRIHVAALRVCGADAGERNLSILAQQNSCAAASETRAIAQVQNQALSAYYQAKVGHPPNRLIAMNDGK